MKREDLAAMNAAQRKELLEDVALLVQQGAWRLGEAVRFLRTIVLRKNRVDFARMVGISPAALQQLEERPDANPTIDTLNRVLRPFGGAMGVVFPRMSPPPPMTEEVRGRHAKLIDALAATRRKTKRSGAGP